MTNLLDNWEEKIKKARGYNVPEGESYIVFDEENEIWDSEYLAKFISSLLHQQKELTRKETLEEAIELINSTMQDTKNNTDTMALAFNAARAEGREKLQSLINEQ